MSEVRTIGLDLAKNVFQVHGADASGAVVFRKQLRRGQVLKFFGSLPRGSVANRSSGRDMLLPCRLSSSQDFELLGY